ncbi:MAG: DoxX family protein [Actinomycetota bacterium]
MDVVYLIGRILFALIFVGSGVGHLADSGSVEYAESKGLPNASLLVRLSGLTMLAGGLGIIFGVLLDVALAGMAAQVLIHSFVMHRFWSEGPDTRTVEMTMFMKNLSIAGGALAMLGLAHVFEMPFTLVDNLF